jgi:hypothetical protein
VDICFFGCLLDIKCDTTLTLYPLIFVVACFKGIGIIGLNGCACGCLLAGYIPLLYYAIQV